MTTKYTPGPWKVGQGGGLGATTAVYALNEEGNQKVIVAACWHEFVQRPYGEIFANARLIAAAPELVEALRELVNGGETFEEYEERCQRAIILLARIEGDKA